MRMHACGIDGATKLCSPTLQAFKFLKELGLQKPAWLPNFGAGKAAEEVRSVMGDVLTPPILESWRTPVRLGQHP